MSPLQPSDGLILEIGPRLEGHSVIFCAFGGGKQRRTGEIGSQFSPIHGARRGTGGRGRLAESGAAYISKSNQMGAGDAGCDWQARIQPRSMLRFDSAWGEAMDTSPLRSHDMQVPQCPSV